MKKILLILLSVVSFCLNSQTVTPTAGAATFSMQALINNKLAGTLTVTSSGGTVVSTPSGTQVVSVVNTATNVNVTSTVSTGTMNVGGFSGSSTLTVPTSTPAYTYSDNIGGILTFTNAARSNGGTSTLNEIIVWDLSNQKSSFTVHFWDASPSGTYTDNLAEVIAGDQAKFLGHIKINAADYTTVGSVATVDITGLSKGIVCASGSTSIYATIYVEGTPSYAANALIVKLIFYKD